VSAVNTPAGSIANGATITITWSYTPQANAVPGVLSIVDNTTKNTIIISSSITLSTQSYQWTVNVPTGTYYLALNDGSGNKYSGTFTVFQPAGAAGAPAPAASGPAAPVASGPAAPAPAASGPAAPAPAASGPAAPAPAASGSAAPAPAATAAPALPTITAAPVSSKASEQSSSSNVGIYIGIAIGGIVVGAILSFVGYRVYKKHQDSKFIPTPSSADL
ncbi:279_t:CDS:1, partial [Dentiscutata heterogama]